MIDHRHAARHGPTGQCLPDAPHTDNTKCLALDIHAQVLEHAHLHRLAKRPQLTVALGDAPCRVEHQGQGQVGGRRRHLVGRIGYRDSFREAIGYVNIIIADGIVGHQPEFWGVIDQLLPHREIEHRAEHVVVGNHLIDLLVREITSLRKGYVVTFLQLREALTEHIVSHQYLHIVLLLFD